MIHLHLHITWHRRGEALLSVLLLLFLFSSSIALKSQTPISAEAGSTAFIPRGDGRHFYLTKTNYYPDQALTACASGYHMASLWELYDVSNLIYDYNHPDAYTRDDSGYGPPAQRNGWVRTGYSNSFSSIGGTGNCNNWSSRSNTHYGVSVRLSGMWETAPGDIGPWDATSFACNFAGPVWCVGHFHVVYLPVISKNF